MTPMQGRLALVLLLLVPIVLGQDDSTGEGSIEAKRPRRMLPSTLVVRSPYVPVTLHQQSTNSAAAKRDLQYKQFSRRTARGAVIGRRSSTVTRKRGRARYMREHVEPEPVEEQEQFTPVSDNQQIEEAPVNLPIESVEDQSNQLTESQEVVQEVQLNHVEDFHKIRPGVSKYPIDPQPIQSIPRKKVNNEYNDKLIPADRPNERPNGYRRRRPHSRNRQRTTTERPIEVDDDLVHDLRNQPGEPNHEQRLHQEAYDRNIRPRPSTYANNYQKNNLVPSNQAYALQGIQQVLLDEAFQKENIKPASLHKDCDNQNNIEQALSEDKDQSEPHSFKQNPVDRGLGQSNIKEAPFLQKNDRPIVQSFIHTNGFKKAKQVHHNENRYKHIVKPETSNSGFYNEIDNTQLELGQEKAQPVAQSFNQANAFQGVQQVPLKAIHHEQNVRPTTPNTGLHYQNNVKQTVPVQPKTQPLPQTFNQANAFQVVKQADPVQEKAQPIPESFNQANTVEGAQQDPLKAVHHEQNLKPTTPNPGPYYQNNIKQSVPVQQKSQPLPQSFNQADTFQGVKQVPLKVVHHQQNLKPTTPNPGLYYQNNVKQTVPVQQKPQPLPQSFNQANTFQGVKQVPLKVVHHEQNLKPTTPNPGLYYQNNVKQTVPVQQKPQPLPQSFNQANTFQGVKQVPLKVVHHEQNLKPTTPNPGLYYQNNVKQAEPIQEKVQPLPQSFDQANFQGVKQAEPVQEKAQPIPQSFNHANTVQGVQQVPLNVVHHQQNLTPTTPNPGLYYQNNVKQSVPVQQKPQPLPQSFNQANTFQGVKQVPLKVIHHEQSVKPTTPNPGLYHPNNIIQSTTPNPGLYRPNNIKQITPNQVHYIKQLPSNHANGFPQIKQEPLTPVKEYSTARPFTQAVTFQSPQPVSPSTQSPAPAPAQNLSPSTSNQGFYTPNNVNNAPSNQLKEYSTPRPFNQANTFQGVKQVSSNQINGFSQTKKVVATNHKIRPDQAKTISRIEIEPTGKTVPFYQDNQKTVSTSPTPEARKLGLFVSTADREDVIKNFLTSYASQMEELLPAHGKSGDKLAISLKLPTIKSTNGAEGHALQHGVRADVTPTALPVTERPVTKAPWNNQPSKIQSYQQADAKSRNSGDADVASNDVPMRYEFGYRVIDNKAGSDFGHEEIRSEDEGFEDKVTSGRYHVLLPDGRLQKVRYYVDKDGYHAIVSYEDAPPPTAAPPRAFESSSKSSANSRR